ncbi:MAG: HAD family hydrolase [Caldilineaceae bacterium]|nr:HAD family hydrolase [Caldilineaceae bacterium]
MAGMTNTVVVLDLDGVILKTNLIKYRAMLALFAEYSALQPSISAYILAHGGVPRREKLATILRDFVKTTPTDPLLNRYLERYAHALEAELARAPLVEGVAAFLAAGGCPFYVSSAAPEAEVALQLERRQLHTYFTHIYGAQTPKAEAVRQVAAAHPTAPLVFFGDAVGDWLAAQATGVAFVAVINERDNFAQQAVVKLRDFTQPEQVERCIQKAFSLTGAA